MHSPDSRTCTHLRPESPHRTSLRCAAHPSQSSPNPKLTLSMELADDKDVPLSRSMSLEARGGFRGDLGGLVVSDGLDHLKRRT